MLSPQAKTYFETLLSSATAASSSELAKKQDSFEREEFSRGQRPDSGGFAARLAELYADSLETHSRTLGMVFKTGAEKAVERMNLAT